MKPLLIIHNHTTFCNIHLMDCIKGGRHVLLSGAVSMDRAEQLRKWAKSVKLKIEEDGPFPDLEFEPSSKLNHSREIMTVDGSPWCEPCQSWHPRPCDKEHHAALRCFAPFES